MKSSPTRSRLLLLGSGLILAVALFFGWQWAGQDSSLPKVTRKESTPAKVEPVASPESPSKPVAPPMAGAANQLTTVEEGDLKIDEILRSEKPIPTMARDLHELVKKLNSEAQVNASRHLVNLTSDEDYGLISSFLVDDRMNPDVIEVLFSDLMNRKRELQLPLFMNILQNAKHPQNEQVRNVMTILAGQDFGQDYKAWGKWIDEEMNRQRTGQ